MALLSCCCSATSSRARLHPAHGLALQAALAIKYAEERQRLRAAEAEAEAEATRLRAAGR